MPEAIICSTRSGKVTSSISGQLVRPMQKLTPALEQMAAADHDITLKKINADESPAEMDRHHVKVLPHVIVYDRNGGIVGTVTGADVKKIKSYVAQAKGAE